ncbi:eCIS core domain-containing protein [Pseudomonas wadenswilerensis]
MFIRTTTALLLCLGLAAPACAAPASQGQPDDLFTLLDNVARMASSGLASWLTLSRDTALAKGVEPIPLDIRAQLEPWYDFQVLDAARYQVGDAQQLDAAGAFLQNPDVAAVTLVDVIVFRNAEDAHDNVALWAHELKHVQQYQEWGVEGFATRYTRNYEAVEAPAYAIQAEVAKSLRLAPGGRLAGH